ncbi:MAG TPA: aminotransferase class I/II-fold pyridoxal phosphate-dependent enzyme [Candidatus Latescibacteria bacterium]|jgi:cystathionine gamma-synthase|nr:cystathionine gamma-synthase [Gemmatimonadaceae bacterium]MDP7631382.1 aminotransferase class I/II-fold pyridoxal phosphate-dependent enzyme [Candidatus Latescibacterota bacterium]HJP31820.1 aminotransferase class I/II-fold pyridoxal phosphate-dependent enzyme [Candidatus Latescibacterota bacterium]|tara:strand:- start:1617 stop:2825 length:1209 start_codon:yes stop_codon:yes gene_type:complete
MSANDETSRRINRDGAGNSTWSVHGGEKYQRFAKSVTEPIAQTATYVFESLDEFEAYKQGHRSHYEYGRYGNPTIQAAEQKLAALDSAEAALMFSSGMSAITTVLLAILRSGQHMIIMEDCYRRTVQLCDLLGKYGVECTRVQPGDFAALKSAVRPETRILFAESPTNPHLHIADLEALVPFAREHRLRLLIDSTFATPINQRPVEYGVDLVFHSATKYLGGHNDLMAGTVCGKAPMIQAIKEFRDVIGTNSDPNTAYLLIRGIKTLALRVGQQNATSLRMAQFLEDHANVRRVFYPGLESHPDHGVAQAQMSGFGGVVSFDIEGDLARARAFIHALRLPYLAPSLGGVESLVSHPATVSYSDLDRDERLRIGITDELIRYSVGIEDADDIITDLEQALEAI